MDAADIAETIGKTLEWASKNAESPAIINVEWNDLGEIEFDAIPGKRWRLVVEEVND